jgi:HTH-type transcriptional regulator/antitoxin HigA
MNWKILKTEEEYNKASMRLMELFHAKVNTAGFEELQLLLVLVSN